MKTLYLLAETINQSWEESGAVIWAEAEELIQTCREIPDQLYKKLPEIQQIFGYACANQDWGSGEVANWPLIIRSEIENSGKEDSYSEDG